MSTPFDMLGGAVDELYERAQVADERPETEGNGDLPPLRWFKFTTPKEKRKYQFGMFLMTWLPEGGERSAIFRNRFQHFNLPVGGNDQIYRTCMAKSLPKENIRCPFCEVLNKELEMTSDKTKRQNLYKFSARGYSHMNVLPILELGRPIEFAQYEGDGKRQYLPHVAKISIKLADSIAQYLRNNNALSDPSINPLNPNNAMQLMIEVDRIGHRDQDVRYSAQFNAFQRSPWASSAEGVSYLYSQAYDLNTIFRFATPEEYQQQWEEAAKFAAELERRRNSRATFSAPGGGGLQQGGFDAPSFQPPTQFATPQPGTAAPSGTPTTQTSSSFAPPAAPAQPTPQPSSYAPPTEFAATPTQFAPPTQATVPSTSQPSSNFAPPPSIQTGGSASAPPPTIPSPQSQTGTPTTAAAAYTPSNAAPPAVGAPTTGTQRFAPPPAVGAPVAAPAAPQGGPPQFQPPIMPASAPATGFPQG